MYIVHPERVDNHAAADLWLIVFNVALLIYLVRGTIESWKAWRRFRDEERKQEGG